MTLGRVHRVHLVGIGGIGMSGLALLLKRAGKRVTGSDCARSVMTDHLQRKGIRSAIGHRVSNIPLHTDLVVISQAIQKDNPELQWAWRRRIPVWTYPEAVSALTEGKKLVTVSGTHGKTTTTAMIGQVLRAAHLHPTILVGSLVKQFGGNAVAGKGRHFVLEADEFARSFLAYHPSLAVVTNIDRDHLDTYGTLPAIIRAFRQFYGNLRRGGTLIVNAEDGAVQKSLRGFPKTRHVAFGLHQGTYHATKLSPSPTAVRFRVVPDNAVIGLRLHGLHNVSNALAAYAACRTLGIKPRVIGHALSSFRGTSRRFERLGTFHRAPVISDYGHHPTEIRATLQAAREAFPNRRILLAFQPHHHGRLAALFRDFVDALQSADRVILTEVYQVAGREAHKAYSKTGKDLWVAFKKAGGKGWFAPTLENCESAIRKYAKANDIILVMGAGSIDGVARKLVPRSPVTGEMFPKRRVLY